jgi:hypothetical protein
MPEIHQISTIAVDCVVCVGPAYYQSGSAMGAPIPPAELGVEMLIS